MGMIGSWMEKRRMNELDRINKEIESLKTHGPHYMAPKEKKESPMIQGKYVKKDTNFGLLLLVGLCIIAIIGLSLFYKQRFDSLTEKYDQKLAEFQALQKNYTDATSVINQTSSQLAFKEKVEKDLSNQFKSLEDQKEDLESDKAVLEDQKDALETKITDLEKKIDAQKKQLNDIEECINDNDVDDKEDCI